MDDSVQNAQWGKQVAPQYKKQADLEADTTFHLEVASRCCGNELWHSYAVFRWRRCRSTTALSNYNFTVSDGESKYVGAYVLENETETFFSSGVESSFGGYISDVRISKGTARYTGEFNDLPTAPLEADTDTKLLLSKLCSWDFEINRMASATYDDVSISTSTRSLTTDLMTLMAVAKFQLRLLIPTLIGLRPEVMDLGTLV